MDVVKRPGRLQLDDQRIFDKQVYGVVTDNDAIVQDSERTLLLDMQPGLAQLVRERVLIDLFEESNSERVGHCEGAANDLF